MSTDSDANNSEYGNGLPTSVGARLRAARTARGSSLADIAQLTRVPQRHLTALEQDQYDKLPALPYTVGFVKAFAKAVGLPPEEVAAQYRAENGTTSWTPQLTHFEPVDDRRVPPRGAILGALAVLLLLVVLATGYAVGWFDSEPVPTPAPVVTVSPPAPAEPIAAEPLAPATDAALAPTTTEAQPSVPPAEVSAPAPQMAAPMAAQGPVVLRATADVWIKISADNGQTTVKMGILRPGESYQLPNMAGLMLWTGKAGALEVRVGGKLIPPLGAPEQTVRNVSLAPADLLARPAG